MNIFQLVVTLKGRRVFSDDLGTGVQFYARHVVGLQLCTGRVVTIHCDSARWWLQTKRQGEGHAEAGKHPAASRERQSK